MTKNRSVLIELNGVVQGVGFRPFVFRLAEESDVRGWVNNTGSGVTIHAEGSNLEVFYERLINELPPLAKVTGSSVTDTAFCGYSDFKIIESTAGRSRDVLISPDVATCSECIAEIKGPKNRRYQYPFTNCTNCGPRYTIIFDIPYDRPNTTMKDFPMCPECAAEYHNPHDRRFHAQPVACPHCGPQVILQDRNGVVHEGLGLAELRRGAIIAVKGLGGFHLACNAFDAAAVAQLRMRKHREVKPFAVMARNLETVRKFCDVNEAEEKLLKSPAAPIVVLKLKASLCQMGLPPELAPNLDTLGVMLPYTPLHHLLLAEDLQLLVMTSANISGEPLIFKNQAALTKLQGIADYWLIHNREIFHPCDDSVVRVINNQSVFFRRARGYVPLPLNMDRAYKPVMGAGGDLKNTFCILKKNQAFVSQYGGDLSNYDNYQQFLRSIESFKRVVNAEPEIIACDLHPEYYSSRYARDGQNLPIVGVQHHHAHMVSCLVENGVRDKVLGVVCDGTGFGSDGKIWGFEFLLGDCKEFERVGQLEYLPLPGGDAAAKHPGRIALAYLSRLFGKDWPQLAKCVPELMREERNIVLKQVEKGLNTFETSSCGRFFDAVAALAGVCTSVDYEGQAAIELEASVDETEPGSYPFEIDTSEGVYRLRVKPLFAAIVSDLANGTSVSRIAARFHHSVGNMIVEMLNRLGERFAINQVALSGGVFQNKYLCEYLVSRLEKVGWRVIRHVSLPPGDGGLCLGQAVIASEVIDNVSGNSGEGINRS